MWRAVGHLVRTASHLPLGSPPLASLLQRVFKIGQAEWMRNVEYEFVVSATNHFCTSDNSTAYEAPLSP